MEVEKVVDGDNAGGDGLATEMLEGFDAPRAEDQAAASTEPRLLGGQFAGFLTGLHLCRILHKFQDRVSAPGSTSAELCGSSKSVRCPCLSPGLAVEYHSDPLLAALEVFPGLGRPFPLSFGGIFSNNRVSRMITCSVVLVHTPHHVEGRRVHACACYPCITQS